MVVKKVLKKNVVSVVRYELGMNGQVKLEFVHNRSKQTVNVLVNDVLAGGRCGALAERFFNKYGLLIK